MTSGVKVTKRGPQIAIDVNAMLDWLVVQAIGMIQRRSGKGQGLTGSFPKYSDLYAMQLRAVGESDKPDLQRSGAYLAGISERSRTVDQATGIARATIGPGTGTSTEMPLPPPWVFDPKKTAEQRAEAFADWKAAPKKKRQSPSHAVLGRLLSMKFKHLGLTKDEAARLAKQAMKIALKQQGR
jgi:hypothetical protein